MKIKYLVILALLWLAMLGLTGALVSSVKGVTRAGILPVALFGVTFSWLISFSRLKSWQIWAIASLTGFIFVFIQTARLGEPLLDLFRSIPAFELQILRSIFEKTPIQSIEIPDALQTIVNIANPLWHNLSLWMRMILAGTIPESLASRRIFWSSATLPLSIWAGWLIRSKQNAFFALGPLILLSAYFLDYSQKSLVPLQIELAVLLAMMGITESEKRIRTVRQNHPRRGEAFQTISSVLVISAFIGIGAGWMPSISITEISEGLKARSQEKEKLTLAEKLGLLPPTVPQKYYSVPGLPREHLIGMDPSRSQNLVFTVQTGELPPMSEERQETPAARHYWRGITYDIYTGQGWAATISEREKYPANYRLYERPPTEYRLLYQKIIKSPQLGERIFWSGTLLSLDQPYQAAWRFTPRSSSETSEPFGGTDLLSALASGDEYLAISLIPTVRVDQLRSSASNYPLWLRERYLALPPGVPQRVLRIAKDLTKDATNPYDRARAIESYLRTFPYTLEIPPVPPGRDVADYFLFDLQKGYCDYYASAMVVMARAVGLPARLITGYASGIYYATEAQYLVREADAHSWVEIYFDGIGWIEFEPTGNRSPIDRSIYSTEERSQLQALIPFPVPEDDPAFPFPASGSTMPLLLLLLSVVGIVIWRVAGSPPRKKLNESIYRIYRDIFRLSQTLIPPIPPNETPTRFAKRLTEYYGKYQPDSYIHRLLIPAQNEIELLTDMYLKAFYGPHSPTHKDGRMAMDIWNRFYWRLLLARLIRRYENVSGVIFARLRQ